MKKGNMENNLKRTTRLLKYFQYHHEHKTYYTDELLYISVEISKSFSTFSLFSIKHETYSYTCTNDSRANKFSPFSSRIFRIKPCGYD